MTAIDRTAYPHSDERLSRQELEHRYSLSEADLVFVNSKARGASGRLTLAVLLKARQDLGFFASPGDLHGETIAHLASQLGLADPLSCVVKDTGEKTLYRYRTAVRTFLGIVAYDERSEDLLTASINLPAFSTLDRLANHLRTKVHTTIYSAARGASQRGVCRVDERTADGRHRQLWTLAFRTIRSSASMPAVYRT
jgi:hypothetical protein